jgi:hypothetical protein
MILGLSISAFTAFHVALSLVGIVSGLVVLAALLSGKPAGAATAIFLVATVLTSVTGFPIPPFGFDPPRALGVLSLVLLGVALVALYGFRLAGRWRAVYVGAALAALYFNCFVGVVQAFQKIAFLKALAPTQTEPAFVAAQGLLLLAFVAAAVIVMRKPASPELVRARAPAG